MISFLNRHRFWIGPLAVLVLGVTGICFLIAEDNRREREARAHAQRQCALMLGMATTRTDSAAVLRERAGYARCSYWMTADTTKLDLSEKP